MGFETTLHRRNENKLSHDWRERESLYTQLSSQLSYWLGRLQLLAHYVTGALMPNARAEY
jgi:hypothetical protein